MDNIHQLDLVDVLNDMDNLLTSEQNEQVRSLATANKFGFEKLKS
jgi:hypothetical protein